MSDYKRVFIVDSNAMRSVTLRNYLASSPHNYIAISDYIMMEAYKDETLIAIYKSLAIVSDFPEQVIGLKSTRKICALSGRSQRLQQRMIDQKGTRNFSDFCKNVKKAQNGDAALIQQLLDHSRAARNQMEKILICTPMMPSAITELRKTFSSSELKTIQSDQSFPASLIKKSMDFIVQLTYRTIEEHPSAPTRIRSNDELFNTFLFRQSVATFVWSLDWIARGGAEGTKPERMRNDIIDTIISTYSTYFDGIISSDKKVQRVYARTKFITDSIAGYSSSPRIII